MTISLLKDKIISYSIPDMIFKCKVWDYNTCVTTEYLKSEDRLFCVIFESPNPKYLQRSILAWLV